LQQVLENKDVHRLSFFNTKVIFSSFYVGMYQPLTTQLYAIIYSVFGASAIAFHSVSLLLHLINVLLVFLLVRSFSHRENMALIVSALFALSPMQTESVAWVSALSNLLYTGFFLSGIIIYLRYVRKGQKSNLFLSLLLFVFSLLSKPTAVTFPVMLVLIDLYFRRGFSYKVLLEKLPFFILSVVVGIVIINAREQAGHIINISENFSLIERLLMVAYALAFYIARLFVPIELSAFHPYPSGALPVEYYIAPLIPLMLIFLLYRLRGEPRRQVMVGLLFFLFTLAIVLELIPVGVQVVKERYVYMPSIGLYYAFGILLLLFTEGKNRKWMPLSIIIVVSLVFSTITFSRAKTWHDSLSLWNDVLEQYPDASAALINRGNAWQEEEDYGRAIDDYSMAIAYEPGAADAFMNRGLAYYRTSKTTEALEDFNRAILLGAADAEAYNSRGLILASMQRVDEALLDFIHATKLDEAYTDAWINQGLLFANMGDFSRALDVFSNALLADDHSAKAHYWRGMVLLQLQRTQEACDDLKVAVSLGWPAEQVPVVCP
jgi:tetratricopeptide (TPR) repeat protein